MRKIIACFNQKGGVAKTTTVHNLGVGLAGKGLKILLLDLDPQASLTHAVGINPDGLEKTISDLFRGYINGDADAVSNCILHLNNRVDLIPSNISLATVELQLSGVSYREEVLSEILKDISGGYDFILIDCSPSLGNLTINALFAADSVLIPVHASYLSVMGMRELISTLVKTRRHRRGLPKIEGILLTMVNERTRSFREFKEFLNSEYGDAAPLYDFAIPNAVKVSEAPINGQAVVEYAPHSPAALAYTTLADKIAERMKKDV